MNRPVNAAPASRMHRFRRSLRRAWQRCVQTARLCCGIPDYEAYVAHLRRHHPERAVPGYAEFFRERQSARYKGTGGRCC